MTTPAGTSPAGWVAPNKENDDDYKDKNSGSSVCSASVNCRRYQRAITASVGDCQAACNRNDCQAGCISQENGGNRMNKLLHTLFMIRLGQELGTDSQTARAVADTIDLLAGMARFFSH